MQKRYYKLQSFINAEMYIADERFTAYYDERVATGATQLLYKAIAIYTA